VLLANMGPAKDKHGVRESFAEIKFLFVKNNRSGIKEFWSTTKYFNNIQKKYYIKLYFIFFYIIKIYIIIIIEVYL